MLLGMAYCLFFVKDFFGIEPISTQAAMLLVVFLIATEAVPLYLQVYQPLRQIAEEGSQKEKKVKKSAADLNENRLPFLPRQRQAERAGLAYSLLRKGECEARSFAVLQNAFTGIKIVLKYK